jgi:hypothetical protein
MYRGGATPSSSQVSASPCMGRAFVSIDTSTQRFLCRLGGGPAGAIHLVSGCVCEGRYYSVCGDGVVEIAYGFVSGLVFSSCVHCYWYEIMW